MNDNSKENKLGKPSEEESDEWMVTYADAMTLVLGFFVLILSMSVIQQSKFEVISKGIDEGLLKKQPTAQLSPLADLHKNLSDTLVEHQMIPDEAIESGENYLKIDLPGRILFATASADLNPKSLELVEEIAKKIKNFPLDNFDVEIEGHTDNVPIHCERFASNWELSSSRAISVLQVFLDAGWDKHKLKAIGYADSFPKVANLDEQGHAIPENQQQNRRVEIKISKKYI
ncbi:MULTISPECIES: OmpA/MotB family protein [Thiomicrorhabdus]|uniref:OmpA family protein n=1 Tax=Thiomicrorhabdus heinhorstiae TaxID=2748010 RepID=A0ABS0BXU8_9GAMM|nr:MULTISPECIES: flagellar motor protein MotB [Thiomicrorhabdus]MBF6058600.1 OmpA family protein [Thiomicrorhabdus heinhorstiae]